MGNSWEMKNGKSCGHVECYSISLLRKHMRGFLPPLQNLHICTAEAGVNLAATLACVLFQWMLAQAGLDCGTRC